MLNITYYFKIKVTYKYKVFTSDAFKTDTAEYEIAIKNRENALFCDIEAEGCDTAKQLCKDEYGDLPHYEYVKLNILEKKTIYIKK